MITFYEKPGCITNRKQKALLMAAGFQLRVESLLDHPWQAEELESFFAELPVSEWFNPSAPMVKNGVLKPAELDRYTALQYLMVEPLLIRRPLLIKDQQRMVGFDLQQLKREFGIDLDQFVADAAADIETIDSCSRQAAAAKKVTSQQGSHA